jgi:geranylgeranyl pyrophosphate synthase
MVAAFQAYIETRRPTLQDALKRALSGLLDGITMRDAASLITSLEAGKKIRGSLTCLVSEALGGTLDSAVPRAISVELIQAATLIHDDFVDQDIERRGRPAVWTVEGARRAVLIGDVIFASAIEMMSDLGREDGAAISHAIAQVSRGALHEPLHPLALAA